jgi:hypothetical protein
MPGLREMIRAELARREEVSSIYLPFAYVVCKQGLTDIEEAVRLIEEEHEMRTRPAGWPAAPAPPPARPPRCQAPR